jgi:hypothetical protein
MAEGFARAADIIAANRFDISPQGDIAFWPAVFLYRHSVELLLKEILFYGSRLKGCSLDIKIMSSHSLKPLWDAARPLLNGNEDGTAYKIVDELVSDFQKVDPRGDAFRYYRSKSGAVHLTELPSGTSLEYFINKAGNSVGVLDGSLTGILEALAMRDEINGACADN